MNINWYPGHMKKAKEAMENNLKMVDMVIELLDARIPISSQNPSIEEVIRDKPRIVVLNKEDLANDSINQKWIEYYKDKEMEVILLDSTKSKGINELLYSAEQIMKKNKTKDKEKGIVNRYTRAMIVGIPNVGKSTLINTLTGRRGAKVGNKPGVTRANQWLKTKSDMQLLDTPGVLWPDLKNKDIGLHLAFTGAIKDEIIDKETLALRLIERLSKDYPDSLRNRYDIKISNSGLKNMEEIGRRRGCIISGGEIDYTRVSNIVLDEFRNGILGKISLENPEDII